VILEAIKPETLITLSGIALILVFLIMGNFRGWYVPGPTHRREVAALDKQVAQAIKDRDDLAKQVERDKAELRAELETRMANFRADHALRMVEAREDFARALDVQKQNHEREMVASEARWGAVLASKQRDADDWRAAYHTGAENWTQSEDRMDTVVEYMRLNHAQWTAITRVVNEAPEPHPQLGPGDTQ
jgi:hypothetical protein